MNTQETVTRRARRAFAHHVARMAEAEVAEHISARAKAKGARAVRHARRAYLESLYLAEIASD